jgi:hypothetical protein
LKQRRKREKIKKNQKEVWCLKWYRVKYQQSDLVKKMIFYD